MKKFLAVVLIIMMMLTMTGCSSLFSDTSIVKFEDMYTHKDPQGVSYTERLALINKNFGPTLEEMVDTMAYPDTMKYDEDGNVVGLYIYDPESGMASGWMDLTTGEVVEEEVELGKPDETLMLNLAGTVTLGSVIYGKDDQTVYAYLYAFLSDAADQQHVKESMENVYGLTMEAEGDKVLVSKRDAAAVDEVFQMMESMYGEAQTDRSASAYANNLKLEMGLRTYGVNPFKPTSEAKDPEGLQYDTKQVLTSNGTYSFMDESLEKDMKVRTDVIYGYQGKAVAHYIYYEYNTKAAVDKLLENVEGNFYAEPERLSDTVVLDKQEGQALTDIIAQYIGYNVMEDDSFDSYVANVEDSYFMMPYGD